MCDPCPAQPYDSSSRRAMPWSPRPAMPCIAMPSRAGPDHARPSPALIASPHSAKPRSALPRFAKTRPAMESLPYLTRLRPALTRHGIPTQPCRASPSRTLASPAPLSSSRLAMARRAMPCLAMACRAENRAKKKGEPRGLRDSPGCSNRVGLSLRDRLLRSTRPRNGRGSPTSRDASRRARCGGRRCRATS